MSTLAQEQLTLKKNLYEHFAINKKQRVGFKKARNSKISMQNNSKISMQRLSFFQIFQLQNEKPLRLKLSNVALDKF